MTKQEACDLSERIGGLSTRGEKEALWDKAMQYVQPGGLAIEVGSWVGGSTVIIGEVCRQKGARLICIDAFSSDMHSSGEGVRDDAFKTVLNNCKGLPIDYMCGDSVHFVNYLKPGIADFIFIDGDHHYPTVKTDIEGYWNALRNNGGYFCHDYLNPCDVKQVVDDFFKNYLVEHIDSSVFIEKG
jgi:predicted O-methyltransferase YrrM